MILEKLEGIIDKRIEMLKERIRNKNKDLTDFRVGKLEAYENVIRDIHKLMNEEIERDVEIIELKAKCERLERELNNLKNGQNIISFSNGRTYIQNKE